MNKVFFALMLLCSTTLAAQQTEQPASYSRPLYLSASTGIGNTVGIIGVSVEKKFSPAAAVEIGIGHSLWWGEKISIGPKIYFSSNRNPLAFTFGATCNTGIKNVDMSYDHHGVILVDQHTDLLPLIAFYAGVIKYFRLASQVRAFIGLGVSISLPTPKYSNPNINTYETTAPQASTLYTTPGGPMIATGLSFRVWKRKIAK